MINLKKTFFVLFCFFITVTISAQESGHNLFQLGELSINIPENDNIDWCSQKSDSPYVNGKQICIAFNVDQLSFFGGSTRNNDGDVNKGLFLDSIPERPLLEARIVQLFKLNGKNYILAHEEGIHIVRTVLYQLTIKNNLATLTKIKSHEKPFHNIYTLVNGVIFSGYNFETLTPWAFYFDGKGVTELKYLSQPNELVFYKEK